MTFTQAHALADNSCDLQESRGSVIFPCPVPIHLLHVSYAAAIDTFFFISCASSVLLELGLDIASAMYSTVNVSALEIKIWLSNAK